jgi:hypothetical protein
VYETDDPMATFCLAPSPSHRDILLCLPSIDRAQAQDKTADAAGASIQVEDFLDLRGDLPNPRRINGSELRQLPRSEKRTINPHDPGKEIVYSGSSLAKVLKAAGLRLDSGMTGVRIAEARANRTLGPAGSERPTA